MPLGPWERFTVRVRKVQEWLLQNDHYVLLVVGTGSCFHFIVFVLQEFITQESLIIDLIFEISELVSFAAELLAFGYLFIWLLHEALTRKD